MDKKRLDLRLVELKLAETRSQAENLIKLGLVKVNQKPVNRAGYLVSYLDKVNLLKTDNYVSRAGLKLEAANRKFKVNFSGKLVLDAGSSTGGFTDYALRHGAKKVLAVDVGTDQLHPKLRQDERVEVHEKTDIRAFHTPNSPDIILADLSFVSLRLILPHLAQIAAPKTKSVVLLKPQFEAGKEQINRGIVKNKTIRRQIIKDFEGWVQKLFKIIDKIDSDVPGEKGNIERFYLLEKR